MNMVERTSMAPVACVRLHHHRGQSPNLSPESTPALDAQKGRLRIARRFIAGLDRGKTRVP